VSTALELIKARVSDAIQRAFDATPKLHGGSQLRCVGRGRRRRRAGKPEQTRRQRGTKFFLECCGNAGRPLSCPQERVIGIGSISHSL
jgi:hypothetical protein